MTLRTKKYYFIILLKDPYIRKVLDAMRFIADPAQKNVSHITVKGPYKSYQKKILEKDNKRISGKDIIIEGVGNFFTGKQNTVFLKCSNSTELYEIWKSKKVRTFKEYNPHITIYDGKDRMFASELFNKLSSEPLHLEFTIDKLDLYESSDKNNMFNLNQTFDYVFISKLIGFDLNQEVIINFSQDMRIYILKKLYLYLESASHQQNKENNRTSILFI